MITLVSFFLILVFIFMISKVLTQQLGAFLFRVSNDHGLTIKIMAFLFLPGTVIHEFSHAAVAQILGVYVGEINLMPKIDGREIKLGTVQIAETDPFRRFLIGVAPLIVGVTLLFLSLAIFQKFGAGSAWWWSVVFYYFVFQVGNSMFSSKKDMEGALELGAALLIAAGILYLVGLRFSVLNVVENLANNLSGLFKFGNGVMLKVVALDLAIIVVFKVGNSLIKRR